MAILSTRQAQRLGRLDGKVSGAARKGDREWGRTAQRQRAAKAQKQHYPTLAVLWARNAARARSGWPLLSVPEVPLTPARQAAREERRLQKRRRNYERLGGR